MGRPIRIRRVLPRTLNASGSEKSCRKGSPPQQDRVTRKQMESSAALSEAGALVSYFARIEKPAWYCCVPESRVLRCVS